MYQHRKTRWSNNSCCEIRERNDKNVRKKTRHQKSGREVKRNSRARKPRKGLISKGCKGCSSVGVPGWRNRMQYHPKKKEEKGRNSVARNPDANRAYEVANPLQIRNVSSARWMGGSDAWAEKCTQRRLVDFLIHSAVTDWNQWWEWIRLTRGLYRLVLDRELTSCLPINFG